MDHSDAEKHNGACLLTGLTWFHRYPKSYWSSPEMPDQVRMVISFTPITDMIGGNPFDLKLG
jgi:hypothetical protein